ncbi:TetR/AcrR family transcriptional regulator [Agrococcus lahaulensis]|uniref:TetR/AcrR family transcriptional regulator n=1 Tax=Agrococcus lahaulensis TaxID=341722 RepID=UPI001FDFF4F7|nr:TetR/AcrR family transcriptional regulator [Agrococcus lahaulensis]
MRESTRDRMLDAAEELFFSRGIAATPVDAVIARAGVSTATMYRGFPSKEALVAAALERRERAWIVTWDAAVDAAGSEAERLLAVFDALDDFRAERDSARWCAFLGAAAEHVDADEEVAAAVRADTEAFRIRLERLAADVAPGLEHELAESLLLVISGHLAMRLRDPSQSSATARRVAHAVIAAIAQAPAL